MQTGSKKAGTRNQAWGNAQQYFRTQRCSLWQHELCGHEYAQVQNVSQSLEVVDLRTARDLQYVRDSEPLLRVVDGRLHSYVANPRALTAKSLQVHTQSLRWLPQGKHNLWSENIDFTHAKLKCLVWYAIVFLDGDGISLGALNLVASCLYVQKCSRASQPKVLAQVRPRRRCCLQPDGVWRFWISERI